MKKEDVEVGATYGAKVGSKTVDVRIESANAKCGWNATAVGTGKPVRVKDARQLRAPAGSDGERVSEPEDGPADDAEVVPLTTLDKEKKRGGKKAKAAKASKPPREKTPKNTAAGKEPKAMSALDAAAAVLKSRGEPMRCADLVAPMKEKGLWETTAPTPAATLSSALLREITKKGADSRFRKADRGLFALNTK